MRIGIFKGNTIKLLGAFNTSFVTEIILKLPESNHSVDINAKCHLTDKLLNYDLTN